MADLISSSKTYQDLLARLKNQIRTAQVRAAMAVNQELVLLYWGIGNEILTRQREDGWGTRVIERLAKDLRAEFPEMQGLSPRNLGYMKAFAEAWPDESILQAPLARLTWYHNLTLLEKLKSPDERLWYAAQTIQNGWSRNVLVMQIESDLYRRQGKALTNFQQTLPAPQSDLAQQLIKDPYNFDFLTLTKEHKSATWSADYWRIFRASFWSWGSGLPSLEASISSTSLERTTKSISSSITFVSTAS